VERQEEPKSMILMALLLGCLNKIFSGLRSQWMMSTSSRERNSRPFKICFANFRTSERETPRNLSEERERGKTRERETGERFSLGVLEELIEIVREHFEHKTLMFSEDKGV
jgi:hypothetical protein